MKAKFVLFPIAAVLFQSNVASSETETLRRRLGIQERVATLEKQVADLEQQLADVPEMKDLVDDLDALVETQKKTIEEMTAILEDQEAALEAATSQFTLDINQQADDLTDLLIEEFQAIADATPFQCDEEGGKKICVVDESIAIHIKGPFDLGNSCEFKDDMDSGAQPQDRADTTYDTVLKSVGDRKIQVIKVVREITGLGLSEAKALVEDVPKTIKEGVSEEEAEEIKTKLEEAGAEVELKS